MMKVTIKSYVYRIFHKFHCVHGTPKVHTIDFYDAKFADDFYNASDGHFTGLHRPQ